jgi:DNA helicase-2/ATP-dependent DNA helicase PcrA
MSWNEGLSPEQEVVASYVGSHSRIIAGPGTGKTLSLTKRIQYLVDSGQEPPGLQASG